jgi:hypothetical protein
MTDRELIKRLLFLAQTAVGQALDLNYDDPEDYFIYRELRELKAAALAQPEPQGPMPEVDDILRLAEIIREVDGNHDKSATALAEAILSHPDCSYDSPAIEPEPQGPTDEELWELYDEIGGAPEDSAWCANYARAVLARWGRPTIEPVPAPANTINQENYE